MRDEAAWPGAPDLGDRVLSCQARDRGLRAGQSRWKGCPVRVDLHGAGPLLGPADRRCLSGQFHTRPYAGAETTRAALSSKSNVLGQHSHREVVLLAISPVVPTLFLARKIVRAVHQIPDCEANRRPRTVAVGVLEDDRVRDEWQPR